MEISKLLKNLGYSENYIKCYENYHDILELEGKIVEGVYSGHSFELLNDNNIKYFVNIPCEKCFIKGKFIIENYYPKKI